MPVRRYPRLRRCRPILLPPSRCRGGRRRYPGPFRYCRRWCRRSTRHPSRTALQALIRRSMRHRRRRRPAPRTHGLPCPREHRVNANPSQPSTRQRQWCCWSARGRRRKPSSLRHVECTEAEGVTRSDDRRNNLDRAGGEVELAVVDRCGVIGVVRCCVGIGVVVPVL